MRNTAEKNGTYTYDIYQSCPHADTRFIISTPRYGKLSVGFKLDLHQVCLCAHAHKTLELVLKVEMLVLGRAGGEKCGWKENWVGRGGLDSLAAI